MPSQKWKTIRNSVMNQQYRAESVIRRARLKNQRIKEGRLNESTIDSTAILGKVQQGHLEVLKLKAQSKCPVSPRMALFINFIVISQLIATQKSCGLRTNLKGTGFIYNIFLCSDRKIIKIINANFKFLKPSEWGRSRTDPQILGLFVAQKICCCWKDKPLEEH